MTTNDRHYATKRWLLHDASKKYNEISHCCLFHMRRFVLIAAS